MTLRRANIATVLVVLLVGILVFGVIVGGCAWSGYHKAVTLDEEVNAKWAQVENQLQRRYDLIPNLVETVKGYAEHETELFTEIAEARTKYFQANTPADKARAASGLEGVLSRLLVLRETYPELKAQEGFLRLQDELAGTENRIAVERQRYNEAVRTLKAYKRGILSAIYSNWAGVQEAEYFEVAETAKEVPKVKFTDDE